MYRKCVARVALIGAVVVCSSSLLPANINAQTGPYDLPPGYRQRERHDPSSSGYMWRRDRGNNTPNPGQGVGNPVPLPVPVPVPGWWQRPWWDYPPNYGWYGPWNPPPLWIPAENMYGPGAVYRMLNAGNSANHFGNAAIDAERNLAREREAPVVNNPPRERRITDAARTRAARYAQVGDEAFREQKYALALARYRRAADSEPDLAEWRFRTGQSLVALGRYGDAAKKFREALRLDPAAPQAIMRLDLLYGPNQIAKASHIEALAQEAIANPENSDLMFLLGVELFMDGQRARSRKFFERADELALGGNQHLRPFLNEIPVQQPFAENDPAADARDL